VQPYKLVGTKELDRILMANARIAGIPTVHLSHRANWLRAAVLGATDGILSVASLLLGVAASGASANLIITAGAAALVAGASSMAAGEYVSVSSQRDSEQADLLIEKEELDRDPSGELVELRGIYERRGLPKALATDVAVVLSSQGALETHARDELGLDKKRRARPMQAAATSAISFASGGALPLIAVSAVPVALRTVVCVAVTLFTLALLGDVGARLGGAPRLRAMIRVLIWGAAAMAITSGIGALIGRTL
jgi:vacuolar iron transporter family protein